MNLQPFKEKQRLLKIAETSDDEIEMKIAMAKLRKINPTYHWCPDWDFMVICDTDYEAKSCLCKNKKRDV